MSQEQRIEPPDDADVDRIAHQLTHAQQTVSDITGGQLSGSLEDLRLLQRVVDAKVIETSATYTLQALGMAFGKVFIDNASGFDWWMVEDEYGRDPAIRWAESSLLAFPQTMLSKRIEDGESVDVVGLYRGLSERLDELKPQVG